MNPRFTKNTLSQCFSLVLITHTHLNFYSIIPGNTGLTQQAVLKHDAMITYSHNKQRCEAENDLTIAKDFENMSVKTLDEGSESEYTASMRSGTYKTFQTFASDWSQCSNISFSK